MNAPELQNLRDEIDKIDQQIVALLAKRFALADHVIEVKINNNIPAAIPERIEAVIAQVTRDAEMQGLPPATAAKIWRVLIGEMIDYEEDAMRRRAG
jgi:isochorismate pyruvate lyase